jgi:hypothetical protein
LSVLAATVFSEMKMRRLLIFVIVLVLALAGFYVAWPGWTGYQIRQAIEANDPVALERRIDFDRVRARAKGLVAERIQHSLDQLERQTGPLGAALAGKLKAGLGGKLADAAINTALTPENVITLAREGKDIGRILKDAGRSRGAGDSAEVSSGGSPSPSDMPSSGTGAPQQQVAPGQKRHQLTLRNIKSYRITGPFEIEVGVAHDPTAATSDILVELAFDGGGWKVVGIVPQF